MKVDEIKECTSESSDWNVFSWILGLTIIPLGFPLVVMNLVQAYFAKKELKKLPGKVVLITGASSGIGESIAHVFYKAGCKVILAARRVDDLERVKNDLLALNAEPVYPPSVLTLDLSNLDKIPEFAQAALKIHNQIDILINNGGISVRSDILSTAVDVDLRVMMVNYFGTVALTKAILPSMIKRQSGHICFMSSVQGKFSIPNRAAYSASKHAIQAFSDALRAEVANKGICVTCISPGYVHTQLSINALTGTGKTYGKMDATTAKGLAPLTVATCVLNAIIYKEQDIVICDVQAKIAYYLRVFCPAIYFWIMNKRAIKLQKDNNLS